jgi:hypothetical protein
MAGTLRRSTFKVPVPCPPVSASHAFQVIPVTVTPPVAHPTVRPVGRTCDVDPGPQESTAGSCDATVVVVGDKLVVEVLVAVDFDEGADGLELTRSPTAIPTPRATRTRTATPTLTTVLRRTLMN